MSMKPDGTPCKPHGKHPKRFQMLTDVIHVVQMRARLDREDRRIFPSIAVYHPKYQSLFRHLYRVLGRHPRFRDFVIAITRWPDAWFTEGLVFGLSLLPEEITSGILNPVAGPAERGVEHYQQPDAEQTGPPPDRCQKNKRVEDWIMSLPGPEPQPEPVPEPEPPEPEPEPTADPAPEPAAEQELLPVNVVAPLHPPIPRGIAQAFRDFAARIRNRRRNARDRH